MATVSSENVSNVSTPTSTYLSPPDSMRYEEVDLNFANTNRQFTGLIKQCFENDIKDGNNDIIRKRYRLQIFCYITVSTTKRMTAYLLDEWAEIMEYFWKNNDKTREQTQISITFYGIRVEKIPEADCDPVQEKNIAFILDENTPNNENVWIEFKTCCNRITGRNGIRLTKQDVKNHLNGSNKLNILNNGNINFLTPSKPYLPLSELKIIKRGCVYGYITNVKELGTCRGIHNLSKQIRIRDATLPWDSDDFQVMFFGNHQDQFPNVREGDLMRIHRLEINYRLEVQNFQGVVKLDKKWVSFIVIDGNLTMPHNKECVRHSNSENYSFDQLVDGYFVKYLKDACRIRQERTNPDLINNINIDVINIPNVLGVNQNMFIYLNEIQQTHDRINLVVMIRARIAAQQQQQQDDDDDDGDLNLDESDNFQFYWVIWDGSNCQNNKDLLQFYDEEDLKINGDNDDNKNGMDVDIEEDENEYDDKWITSSTHNIGSLVKILVSSEYMTAVQCYNDINVGSWVELSNIKVDHQGKQLIYDKHSKIYSKINWKYNKFIQQRHEMLYFNIIKNTNIITHISSIIPHHQYQSWTTISTILKIKQNYCKYKIRGRCIAYHPINIQTFTKKKENSNNEYKLQFVLWIKDASDSKISVIFDGKEAERFFGIENAEDLTKENSEQLQEIGHCMENVMNKSSLMDLCIRSFKPKGRNLILYKMFDTVLIK